MPKSLASRSYSLMHLAFILDDSGRVSGVDITVQVNYGDIANVIEQHIPPLTAQQLSNMQALYSALTNYLNNIFI